MKNRFASALIAFTLLSAALALPASGQKAWTFETDLDSTEFLELDLRTAETEVLATFDAEWVSAMKQGPDGALYFIGLGLGPNGERLYRFDPETFAYTEVGRLNLPTEPSVDDIAFLPDGRLLMAAVEQGSDWGLYEIDPATGQAALIGQTAARILALTGYGDRVLGGCDFGANFGLCEIAPDTADVTFLDPLSPDLFGSKNAMVHGLDGRLYLLGHLVPLGSPPLNVLRTSIIDPSTGEFERLGGLTEPAQSLGYRGLVLIDDSLVVAVPGPGFIGQAVLWTLLALCGLVLIRNRPY